MRVQWEISDRDVTRVKKLIEEQIKAKNRTIRSRKKHNLTEKRLHVRRSIFWRTMVNARLTTLHRSGRGSPVDEFMKKRPFPLAYRTVRAKPSPEEFMAKTLKNADGIRHHNRIARELAYNLAKLENGEWGNTLDRCNELSGPGSTTKEEERNVANDISRAFKGFGPKQTRNLLQMLGLTRYEIPIDSRLTKWLKENILVSSTPLNSGLLGNREYYECVLDGIQELCERADVYPCIFDAAVFTVEG